MSCGLSVYFLVVFKTVLKGLWTFGFVGLIVVFWVQFVELGGLLTPFSVTKLSLAASRLVETQVASASLHAQVTCSSLFHPAFSLYPFFIQVCSRLKDNS